MSNSNHSKDTREAKETLRNAGIDSADLDKAAAGATELANAGRADAARDRRDAAPAKPLDRRSPDQSTT